jgi:hypothetical protein
MLLILATILGMQWIVGWYEAEFAGGDIGVCCPRDVRFTPQKRKLIDGLFR